MSVFKDIKTLDDIYAPAKLTMHLAEFEGDANIDLKLVLADGYTIAELSNLNVSLLYFTTFSLYTI